jgi:CubicO group peptidase (beta-lactamase class C family)
VDRETLFPLASMSKWITAYGVMQLVQAGKIDLDAPVSRYLRRWQLPAGAFDNEGVTVRRLLSHTAGLTDQLGFADYEPGAPLPSLEDSLRQPRASSGTTTIAVGRAPGSEWQYSGGGYLILQMVVEEVSGMGFAEWMQQAVFNPIDMQRSSYAYIGDLDNASPSYDGNGKLAKSYKYAAAAATGLSASAGDLVKFTQAQLPGAHPGTALLSAANVAAMRQPHGRKLGADIWGLGTMLYAPSASGDFVFGHDGSNEPAINTALRINPDNGDAIIVLVTGNSRLASSLGYEWTLWQTGVPDFLMLDRAIESALLPLVVGLVFILVVFVLFIVRQRRTRSLGN